MTALADEEESRASTLLARHGLEVSALLEAFRAPAADRIARGVAGAEASLPHSPEVRAILNDAKPAVVLTTAVPVAVYVLCLFGLYTLLSREADPFHLWLVAGTAVVILAAIVMAAADAPIAACLLVLQYDIHPAIGLSFGPITFMILASEV